MNGDSSQKFMDSKAVKQYQDLVRRASCHPTLKPYMTPTVQSILTTFPVSCLCWPIGAILDPFLLLVCCPCESIWLFF